ncbi:MAG: transposase, partial [Eubacterium sp.]
GKSTSKTFKKLGTLVELSEELNTDRDGVMAWAKEQARIATEIYKKENETISVPFAPNRTIDKNSQRSFNCGYLFLQSIYSDLRFDNIIRNIKKRHDYEYNLDSILSDLIYSRILKPSSKKSSYLFAQSLLEQPKYQLHDLYRALSVLAQESDYIQLEVYRNSNFIHKRNTKVLYYDCTNYYFEIEQEDGNKKYGKSKENRPNPIIGMGLFMDADGFPLAFDLHPGNQNEQMTLKPLEQKVVRDFDCSEFIYCSDSGLASKNNKLFNSTNGRNFVITQSLKKLKKEDREIALNSTQYRKIGCNQFIDLKNLDESDPEVYQSIYYKEIPLDSKIANETLIV